MLRNTNASLANLPAVTGSDLRNFDVLSCDLFLRRSLVNCQKRLKKNKNPGGKAVAIMKELMGFLTRHCILRSAMSQPHA